MNDSEIPAVPPPPYSKEPTGTDAGRLNVNIPVQARRSMEDEMRPLPQGWIRQWDSKNQHQFFVNTNVDPPKSIWHHPHDDDEYLSTLSSEARERLQEQEASRRQQYPDAEGTDEEPESPTANPPQTYKPTYIYSGALYGGAGSAAAGTAAASSSSSAAGPSSSTSRPEIKRSASSSKEGFGRRMKDKLTGTTHEERVAERARRAEQERKAYEVHLAMRRAMSRAIETGQPQFVCKDPQGRDVYVEPPQYGGGYANPNYRGYNPYSHGPYTDPNARYIRPSMPYGRPYGGGYGGGMGLPLAGGLAGGLLLGGLLGGF